MPVSTNPSLANGVQLQHGNGATPEVFAALAKLTTVPGPARKRDTKDTTNLDSTSKEFIGGLPDNGEIQLDGEFVDGGAFDTLNAAFDAGTIANYQITFPAGITAKKWAFAAMVTSIDQTMKSENVITFKATLKISGAATWA